MARTYIIYKLCKKKILGYRDVPFMIRSRTKLDDSNLRNTRTGLIKIVMDFERV